MRLIVFVMGATVAFGGNALAEGVQVPFVGCRSDGQVGPEPPPKNVGQAPKLPKALASQLDWYASNNTGGVLGPRGWHCFELEGSNGSTLMVQPVGFGSDPLGTKLSGPAIELSISLGDTSGRFEAAELAARLFPNRKVFIDSVIAEGIKPKKEFAFGPFPHDRITRLTQDAVAFETPSNEDGMGTESRLVKSTDPIRGLVWMDDDNNATLLAVRLAPSQTALAAPIVGATSLSLIAGGDKKRLGSRRD